MGCADAVERGARWVIWCRPRVMDYVDIKVHADGRVDGKANYRVAYSGQSARFTDRDARRLADELPLVHAEALALAAYMYTSDML